MDIEYVFPLWSAPTNPTSKQAANSHPIAEEFVSLRTTCFGVVARHSLHLHRKDYMPIVLKTTQVTVRSKGSRNREIGERGTRRRASTRGVESFTVGKGKVTGWTRRGRTWKDRHGTLDKREDDTEQNRKKELVEITSFTLACSFGSRTFSTCSSLTRRRRRVVKSARALSAPTRLPCVVALAHRVLDCD